MSAVVVECKLPSRPSRIEEAKTMAETLGYRVVDVVVQRRQVGHQSQFIGSGKIDELKEIVVAKGVGVVVFTNTLPSSRIFEIQRRLGGVRVIDRNLLILEVFDQRAMTEEAKLQIKLARLRYTLSWGRELIKLRGIAGEQVGQMGPGDYPFQEYYRAARNRISRLEKELQELSEKKETARRRRRELGFPIVALAGYTQSGKTTLFNRLAAENKKVGLGPFTTLSTFTRKISLDQQSGQECLLVDSIGFIDEMHPIIFKAFNATFGEIAHSDIILLFIDASEDLPTIARRCSSMNQILQEIDAEGQTIVCPNKIDLITKERVEDVFKTVREHFTDTPIVSISALTGENLDELLAVIAAKLRDADSKQQVSVFRSH